MLLTAVVTHVYFLITGTDTKRTGVMATSNDPLIETRFFTVGEIARIARVSKMTVYREVHAGRLDSVRIGRSFRIPEESVRRWLGGTLAGAA
jgi:excisionase family DNA binding protein